MLYAFVSNSTACSVCNNGEKHYYVTKEHKIVTGSHSDLEYVHIPYKVVPYNKNVSDIKQVIDIREVWPELFQGQYEM